MKATIIGVAFALAMLFGVTYGKTERAITVANNINAAAVCDKVNCGCASSCKCTKKCDCK